MNKLFRRFGARSKDGEAAQKNGEGNKQTSERAKAAPASNGQTPPDQTIDQHYTLTPDSSNGKTLTLTTPTPNAAALHTVIPSEPLTPPATSAPAAPAPANTTATAESPREAVVDAPYPSHLPQAHAAPQGENQDGAEAAAPPIHTPTPAATPLVEQTPAQHVEKHYTLAPETVTPKTHTLTSATPAAAALHTATPTTTPTATAMPAAQPVATRATTATLATLTNGNSKRPNSKALIQLNDVNKAYQTPVGEFVALRDINLAIGRGEFVAVVGKSGSGKSTLINMITGIDRPSSGEIFIENTPIHNLAEGPMAEWRGRNIGIIFQFFQLLPMLSCIENVMLPMDFCNMFKPSERESRALHLLEQVDMVEHAYKLPSEVSGGQQQRVAIARALANDPPLLVADEPTGNLDSRTADAVFQLFSHMVDDGKTILMVTHDDEMAHQVRRTITLTDGQIVDDQAMHRQVAQAAAPETVPQV